MRKLIILAAMALLVGCVAPHSLENDGGIGGTGAPAMQQFSDVFGVQTPCRTCAEVLPD